MRLFYDNLIDPAAVTITAGTEEATLPGENVANELRTKVYRTGTSTANETLTFDLATAQAVTSIILLDHTLTAGDSAIQLAGNTADSWGAPAFTTALTWDSGPIHKVFAAQSYRYWRLSFTKASAGAVRDIGRVFLGTYYESTTQPDYDGYKIRRIDRSTRQDSIGGQTYTEIRNQFRQITLGFSGMPQAQATALRTWFETVGRHTSFFLVADQDGAATAELQEPIYCKLGADPQFDVSGTDSGLVWDADLILDEQL